MSNEAGALDAPPEGLDAVLPDVVDQVALARLYGEPLFDLPRDLYIPPDALQVFLEAFEGPLDLLLYLIRKQNFNILDIPMAAVVTRQYLSYVDEIRASNLELAAEYLLMAAMLIEIKSRMLLPPKKTAEGEEAEDPRAELVRRLLEYEQMKLAAQRLAEVPQYGRDFLRAQVYVEQALQPRFPDVSALDLQSALARHHETRQTGPAPQDQPRGTVGARAHEYRAAPPAGPQVRRVRRAVRHHPRPAGHGRHLHRHARTGQGNPDRADPGRGLRADLRPSGVHPCIMTTHHFDVLIIGSGLAGLTAALKLAPTHRVAVVTKRGISDGSSNWAQGGIAAVLAEGDSYASHVDDTLVAGAGLCDLGSHPVHGGRTLRRPSPGCRNWACPSPPKTANCT